MTYWLVMGSWDQIGIGMAGRHHLPKYARRRGGASEDLGPGIQTCTCTYCTSFRRYPQPLWEWERDNRCTALSRTSGTPHRRVMEEHTQGGDSEWLRRCNSHMGPGQIQRPTACQLPPFFKNFYPRKNHKIPKHEFEFDLGFGFVMGSFKSSFQETATVVLSS